MTFICHVVTPLHCNDYTFIISIVRQRIDPTCQRIFNLFIYILTLTLIYLFSSNSSLLLRSLIVRNKDLVFSNILRSDRVYNQLNIINESLSLAMFCKSFRRALPPCVLMQTTTTYKQLSVEQYTIETVRIFYLKSLYELLHARLHIQSWSTDQGLLL